MLRGSEVPQPRDTQAAGRARASLRPGPRWPRWPPPAGRVRAGPGDDSLARRLTVTTAAFKRKRPPGPAGCRRRLRRGGFTLLVSPLSTSSLADGGGGCRRRRRRAADFPPISKMTRTVPVGVDLAKPNRPVSDSESRTRTTMPAAARARACAGQVRARLGGPKPSEAAHCDRGKGPGGRRRDH